MAEAACSCGKSGLFICQKKPIHVAKEAYSRGKRDLLILAYLRVGDVEANELQEGPASVHVADLLFQQPVQEHRDGVGEGQRDQHKQVGDRYCARSCRTCVCVCVCVCVCTRVCVC